MRIACFHLPSFPLQARVRRAPHLAGKAVAVSGDRTVVSASRAAREAGVRPGMPLATARSRCPMLTVVTTSADELAQTTEAAADVLRPLADEVEVAAAPTPLQLSIYMGVPRGVRGSRFGESALGLLARQGFRARAGIADDRFTAWVAACAARDPAVISVPRGGAAAFLAPRSLELLPLESDVRSMLRALGVRTLGEFEALPPPSIARPGSSSAFDLQDLARGEGLPIVRGNVADSAISDRIEVGVAIADVEPLSFAVRPLVDRVTDRLRARRLAASTISVRLEPAVTAVAVQDRERALESPTASPRVLLDQICVAARELAGCPIGAVELTVSSAVPHEDEAALLLPGFRVEPISRWVRGREASRGSSQRRTAGRRSCADAGERGLRSNDSA